MLLQKPSFYISTTKHSANIYLSPSKCIGIYAVVSGKQFYCIFIESVLLASVEFFFFNKKLSQSKLIHCCISSDYLIDSMQRVSRPRGGINEWLHWLPISLHKKVDYFITQVFGYSQFQLVAPETSGKHKEDHSSFAVNSSYF